MRALLVALVHIALLASAYIAAILLRFEFETAPLLQHAKAAYLVPYIAMNLIALHFHRVLLTWWRYTSISDLYRIVVSAAIAHVSFVLYMVLVHRLGGFPRSVFILTFVFAVVMIGGSRAALKGTRDYFRSSQIQLKRVLLLGAGDAGQMLAQEIGQNPTLGLHVVGFLDDDASKQGCFFHGVPVAGRISDLGEVARSTRAKEAILTVANRNGDLIRRVVEACRQAGVQVRMIPAISEILDGRVSMERVRRIRVDDLLGREAIELGQSHLTTVLQGRRVLVTGAGGSIGREIATQLLALRPERLVLFERSEVALFHIDRELRSQANAAGIDPNVIVPVLGDITHPLEVHNTFARHRPEIVYHAAAYKHVPLAEAHRLQSLRNNIGGTHRLLEAAEVHGARDFVLISTDKAVNPVGIMGATKRVAELTTLSHRSMTGMKTCAVRFGNVLGSDGSVVELFEEMIAKGGPVMVTHPEMTRYFMTIPEASQLVLQTTAMSKGTDLFMLRMGDPIKIVELARTMISLSGLTPDRDISIAFSGLRPGERLHEQLSGVEEQSEPSGHPDVSRILSNHLNRDALRGMIAMVLGEIENGNEDRAVQLMWDLIWSASQRDVPEAAVVPFPVPSPNVASSSTRA